MAKKGGKDPNDVLPGTDNMAPPDATTSQFVPPVSEHNTFSILTEDEAELKGDYTALSRIKLANAARELNERFDVNGDGVVPNSKSNRSKSMLYRRDEFGGYYSKKGYYHDRFGGYYDEYGYSAKDGSYTSIGGGRWNSKTGKVTNADGTERTQTSVVVQEAMAQNPEIGRDQVRIDTQVAQHREAEEGKQPSGKPRKVNEAAAAKTEGGGQGTTVTVTTDDQKVGDIVLQTRIENRQDTSRPVTSAEYKHARQIAEQQNEAFRRNKDRINYARNALTHKIAADNVPVVGEQQVPTNKGGGSRKLKFEAISKEVATAKIGHVHLPKEMGTHIHGPGDHGSATHAHPDPVAKAGDDSKPKDEKADAATPGSSWYADSRGGYWDEFGGYYDKDGGYWEVDGGYWDKFNNYTDKNGGRHYADGSYLDPDFNYVNKDGVYFMSDGTQIKPPAGMDFKKQMQEAAEKNEKWTLPAELTPILQSYNPVLPELNLAPATLVPPLPTDIKAGPAPKVEPVTSIETTIKLEPVSLKIEPVKLAPSLDLTPLKLGTNLAPSTTLNTNFSLLDPKQNSTSAKSDNAFNVDTSRFQMCTTQNNPKNDFSSFFNNYHTFLSTSKPTAETKFYDLSNITLSPSIDSKPMFASLTTPADKTAAPTPKNLA